MFWEAFCVAKCNTRGHRIEALECWGWQELYHKNNYLQGFTRTWHACCLNLAYVLPAGWTAFRQDVQNLPGLHEYRSGTIMAEEKRYTFQRKILILLDGPVVRSEVTRYSVELALRMKAKLYLLMLLRWRNLPGSGGPWSLISKQGMLREKAKQALQGCLKEIQGSGVDAEGAVRQGDPASELLKYLAESKPFQAVIWGGNESFLRRKGIPKRDHWLERVREELDCALVIPFLRKSGKY